MNTQQPAPPHKHWWRHLAAVAIVVIGGSISWAIVAEYLLQIERRYWIWVPVYLVLVVLYWVPAWGAIASQAEAIAAPKARVARSAGCLVVAVIVFLLICALLAILFMQ